MVECIKITVAISTIEIEENGIHSDSTPRGRFHIFIDEDEDVDQAIVRALESYAQHRKSAL
jgi:hypothetical protein